MKRKFKVYEIYFDSYVVNARTEKEARKQMKDDFKKGYYPIITKVEEWK